MPTSLMKRSREMPGSGDYLRLSRVAFMGRVYLNHVHAALNPGKS